jgi:hypothetical protein
MQEPAVPLQWNSSSILWLCGGLLVCDFVAPKQVITTGALVMELSAAFVLGATVVTYDYLSHKESMY